MDPHQKISYRHDTVFIVSVAIFDSLQMKHSKYKTIPDFYIISYNTYFLFTVLAN